MAMILKELVAKMEAEPYEVQAGTHLFGHEHHVFDVVRNQVERSAQLPWLPTEGAGEQKHQQETLSRIGEQETNVRTAALVCLMETKSKICNATGRVLQDRLRLTQLYCPQSSVQDL